MNTFVQQGHIKFIKNSIYSVIYQKLLNYYKLFLFQINAVLWTLYSFKNPGGKVSQSPQNIKQFNLDNNKKCFLSKSAY